MAVSQTAALLTVGAGIAAAISVSSTREISWRNAYVKFQTCELRRDAGIAGRACRNGLGGNRLAEESSAAHAGESAAEQPEQEQPSGREERPPDQVAVRRPAPRGPPGAAGRTRHGESKRRPYHEAGTEGPERSGKQHQRSDSAEITG